MNTVHHFLKRFSVFGSSMATKASGDNITHNITKASRTPSRNTVVTTVIHINIKADKIADIANRPAVTAVAVATIPVKVLPFCDQEPSGTPSPACGAAIN